MVAKEGELGRSWLGAKEGNRCVMQQLMALQTDCLQVFSIAVHFLGPSLILPELQVSLVMYLWHNHSLYGKILGVSPAERFLFGA